MIRGNIQCDLVIMKLITKRTKKNKSNTLLIKVNINKKKFQINVELIVSCRFVETLAISNKSIEMVRDIGV